MENGKATIPMAELISLGTEEDTKYLKKQK